METLTRSKMKNAPALCGLWDNNPGALVYAVDPAFKALIHRDTKAFLRNFALKEMGLAPGTFEVRSNLGGVAVTGEVTLHTDTVYIQVSGWGTGFAVLYRTCKGRKDYTGGFNRWSTFTSAFGTSDDRETFAKILANMRG